MFFKKNKNKNSVLGIDFRNKEVRIVELEKIKDEKYEYKILNYVIEKLPNGTVNEDKLDIHIGEILKEISIKEKFKDKIAVTSIPSSRVLEKEIPMISDISEKEIEDIIKNSSKQHIEKGIDNMAFDFYEIKKENNDDAEDRQIMLVMCQKDLIESRIDVLNMADIIPLVIDTTNNGYLNIMPSLKEQYKIEIGQEPNDNDVLLLVDVKDHNINLYFYKNENIRSTQIEFSKLSNESIEDYHDRLIQKLESEIKIAKYNEENINGVFLMGKLKKLKPLEEKMKSHDISKHNILISNPFSKIKYAGVNYSTIIEASSSLVLACGLAMGETKKYEY